ncbi:mannose-P-dolichol utilization defect 1 protein homolog [Thrips palmi]|uniref:Mannose-P-dolichol utilization defect 1 protein homolog n=1 Tax=Thrips palmi TaxID=161013 RepID=A0A6P8ZGT4_THRPL|nr:mannose-P-dolichol utilization defect 1 protein homolog [Thrips palmi]
MAMNVTTYFRSACLLVLTPQCFDEFFVNYNFLDVPCLEAALSKGLGYGIIMGSVMVKVPQILKIWNARSGEGISLAGVLLDLSAITANVAYSFVLKYPFSAWGEGMFLVVQTAVIAALVLHFGGRPAGAVTFSAVYVAILGALLSGYTPMPVLTFLQSMCVPVVILGKTIQIRSNYQNGSTGQLSAATVLMLLAGSLARIFTSQKETGDALLVFTYMVAATLNAITAAQLFYYWNADKDKKKKVKKN